MIPIQNIDQILQEWAQDYTRRIKSDASKIPKLTGSGIDSFRYQLLEINNIKTIIISFEQHLRLHDMRRVRWDRVPNIDAIKDFVDKKGISKFEPKFRAKYGYLPKSRDQLLNQIAWGIGLSMYKRGRWLSKRKKFYNKNNAPSLNILYRDLIDQLATTTIKDLKQSITNPGL
jgi:hypothetical protein